MTDDNLSAQQPPDGQFLLYQTEDGHTPMDVALGMANRQIVNILNSAGGNVGVRKNVGKGWIR